MQLVGGLSWKGEQGRKDTLSLAQAPGGGGAVWGRGPRRWGDSRDICVSFSLLLVKFQRKEGKGMKADKNVLLASCVFFPPDRSFWKPGL